MTFMRGIAFAALLSALPFAHATDHNKIDQNSPTSTSTVARFDQGGLAQSFKQSADNITGAGIFLSTPFGEETQVTIELWTKLPNLGGSRLATASAKGQAGSWVDVFWPKVMLDQGATYYLVFNGTPGFVGVLGDLTDPYADGQLYANSGFDPQFTWMDFTFRTFAEAQAVPEPAAWSVMLGGLALLAGIARRRA